MDVTSVEDPEDTTLFPNQSTFMVNIGTHKLPKGPKDFETLKSSLDRALRAILGRPRIHEQILGYVEVETGGKPLVTSGVGLQVTRQYARFAIERGTKTGRVDAHILMHFVHNTRVQFNTVAFRDLLDQALELENVFFHRENILDSDGHVLRWAEPHVYVSVRLIGRIQAVDAEAYINKQYSTAQEKNTERNLRTLLRRDLGVP